MGSEKLEVVAMNRPVTALVLAIASAILVPIVYVLELGGVFFAAMVTYEPANPVPVKIWSLALVAAMGVVILVLPVIAIIASARARAAASAAATGGRGLATAALVIASVVGALAVTSQVYVALWVAGVCSLEGC